jgi:hypothetical protein
VNRLRDGLLNSQNSVSTRSQPRHLPGVEPEFPETESTGTHPEPTRKPIDTRPESIRSSSEPPGADPEINRHTPGVDPEAPGTNQSRPRTHPEPNRNRLGADLGRTLSRIETHPEPNRNRPGAEPGLTRGRPLTHWSLPRTHLEPIRKSTGIRPESTRGPPEPTRVDSELTGTDPEPIRNLLGADPEPTRNRQRAPIFQKDNRPGLSKKTAVVDLWNVRASC